MISKYEKTNGVKLLTAFMVMAMIVAGAAVVFSEENVDAATTTDTGVVEVTDVTEITQAGKYYINSDVSADALSLSDTGSILYLGSKAVVKLSTGTASDLEIRVAASFANGTVYYDSGLSIDADDSATYSVKNSGIATLATPTKGFGIVYTPDNTGEKIYYASGSSPSIPVLTANQAVFVSNGTVTVSQGANTATIVGAESDVTKGITVAYAESNPTITINNTPGADTSITITGGFFDGTSLTNINAVDVIYNTDKHVYTNQFVSKVAADNDVVSYTINGDFTQKSSVTVSKPVTISAGATYVISNNATVTAKDVAITNNGSIVLMGSLVQEKTTTDTLAGLIYIGPNGYTNMGLPTVAGTAPNYTAGAFTPSSPTTSPSPRVSHTPSPETSV